MDILAIIANIILFASVGAIGLLVTQKVKLPYSLVLVILGYAASFLIVPLGWDTGIRAHNFQDLMLFILLPILIFEAAYGLNSDLLFKFMPNVITLATLGLVISTLVTAVFLFYGIGHPGFPFIAALLAGVVISATDPVAVVTQLKELKAPENLNVLIEGESLFNDATAIVLFSIILSIALGTSEPSFGSASLKFITVFGGGIIVGCIVGLMGSAFTKIVDCNLPAMSLATLLLAYGSFYLAEHLLHVSGIVAVLFSAIVFKRYSQNSIEKCEHELHGVWETLGFIANIFVFVLLGLVVSHEMFTTMWLAIIIALFGAFLARIIAVYGSVFLNRFTYGRDTDPKYPPVMIWGGLRGAVTIALVLSLPVELDYWYTIQSIGFGVVIFTLVVQATTTPMLMKKLNIH